MAKKYITEVEVESCGDCPALSGFTSKCFRSEPVRKVDDIDEIPDWCPLEETE